MLQSVTFSAESTMKHFYWVLALLCVMLLTTDIVFDFYARALENTSTLPTRNPKSTRTFPQRLSKTLILVTGTEGSGTTYLSHLLDSTKSVEMASQNNNNRFSLDIDALWNSCEYTYYEEARNQLLKRTTSFFGRFESDLVCLHRSYPDFNPNHYPDLLGDFPKLMNKANVSLVLVVSYRDPKLAAFSNYRRNWTHTLIDRKADIRRSCLSTEKHLILLNSQLLKMDSDDFIVVNFDNLRETPIPQLRKNRSISSCFRKRTCNILRRHFRCFIKARFSPKIES